MQIKHRSMNIVIFLILIFSCKNKNSLKMEGSVTDEKHSTTNSIKIPKTLNDLKHSASPFEYAVISKHIYKNDIKEQAIITLSIDNKKICLPDWKVLKIFKEEKNGILAKIYKFLSKPYGYIGALYCNDKRKLIVWAHRGTNPQNLDSLKTDITSITNNDIGGQECLTSSLLQEIIELIDRDKKNYSFSSTGHSLGGWLAQITTFIGINDIGEDRKRHFKAVTFDAPGAKPMLTKLNSGQNPLDLNDLDITNYVSSPNLVNCINPHIGTLYRVVFEKFPSFALKYTLASHSSTNFIKAFNPIKGTPYKCLYIEKWPLINCNYFEIIYKSLKKISLLHSIRGDHKLLGQYSGFFKFANDVNKYEPTELDRICKFKLQYKYHYKALKYIKHRSNLRHLSKQAYNLVNEANHQSYRHYEVLSKNGISNIKLLCKGKKETDIQINNFDNIIKTIDILETIVRENPKLGKELTLDERYAGHIWRRINSSEPPIYKNEFNGHGENILELSDPPYIKREKQVLTIRNNFLKSHHSKWQAVTSYGGLGKSTLAAQYARKYYNNKYYNNKFYNQVWWINAERDTTFKTSIKEILICMGIYSNNISSKALQMKKMLKKYPGWLVVFDNLCISEKSKSILKLCKHLIPNQEQEQLGHILITSRNAQEKIWEFNEITNYKLSSLDEKESIELLSKFHAPQNGQEKEIQKHIVSIIERFPIIINLIGSYITNLVNDEKPYEKFLHRYINKGKIKFLIDINDIEDEKKDIYKILKTSLKEVENEESEAIRILRIMSVINPCLIDNRLFHYLRPSRKNKIFKGIVNDKSDTIDESTANKSIRILRKYGIIQKNGIKNTIHRTLQEIMRFEIEQKNDITENILDQAIQLFETMKTKSLDRFINMHDDILTHIDYLMHHLKNDFKQQLRLLKLRRWINNLEYLNENFYIPPITIDDKPVHDEVLKFIKSKHSLFTKNKSPFGIDEYSPQLILLADAGMGKSTYLSYLERKLWGKYEDKKIWSHLPIFISLPEFCAEGVSKNLLELAFSKYGFSGSTINEIKKNSKSGKQPWVFLLDGFDEIKTNFNLAKHCNFYDWGIKYNKYIISCRSVYYDQLAKQNKINLLEEFSPSLTSLSKQIYIPEIKPEKIDLYIQQYIKMKVENRKKNKQNDNEKDIIWNLSEYKEALAKLPSLRDIMQSPFLMLIILENLPKLYKKEKK